MLKIKPKNELLDSYHMAIHELEYIIKVIQRKTRKTVIIENMTVIDYEFRYGNTQYIIEISTNIRSKFLSSFETSRYNCYTHAIYPSSCHVGSKSICNRK